VMMGATMVGTAAAHHSPAAFDLSKQVVLDGTLTKLAFMNPHIYLTLEVNGPDGVPLSQDVEAGPISTMQPLGLTRDALRLGDHIVVRARPSRRGLGHTVLGLDVTRDDGKTFPLFLASASVAPTTSARATGLAGMWLPMRAGFSALNAAIPSWPLTDEGRRKLADARRTNSTTHSDCVPAGAPMLMVYPVATAVKADASTVVFDIDWLDARRVVHLGAAHPASLEPTLQGHSIGYWEGKTLVADTIGFAEHAEGMGFGMPSSDRKHLVERFTLSDDGTHITYEVTVEDPIYLTEPVQLRAQWEYHPDLAPSGVACDIETARRYLREAEQ
jgi:hypothetical protein